MITRYIILRYIYFLFTNVYNFLIQTGYRPHVVCFDWFILGAWSCGIMHLSVM